MKAIKYNGQIKLLSDFKSFKNILNIQNAPDNKLYELGFKDVVYPPLSEFQRHGELYYLELTIDASGTTSGGYFTCDIVDWTQQEIDDYFYNLHLKEQLKFQKDGKKAFNEIKIRLIQAERNGLITKAQLLGFKKILMPELRPLLDGDWDIARNNLDALQDPTNQTVLNIVNQIKAKILDYIISNNI